MTFVLYGIFTTLAVTASPAPLTERMYTPEGMARISTVFFPGRRSMVRSLFPRRSTMAHVKDSFPGRLFPVMPPEVPLWCPAGQSHSTVRVVVTGLG